MSESKNITGPILAALEKAGYFAERMNSGTARRGKYYIKLHDAGTADIMLCLPNRLPIWIETKTAEGKTNPEQREAQSAFAFKVTMLGHQYVRATSLDDVLGLL